MRKLLAIFLIFSGIVIMLYPKGTQLYSSYMQKKLLNKWENQTTGESSLVNNSYKDLNQVFAESKNNEESETGPDTVNGEQQILIGTIEIKKINLVLPILEGANQKNLKIAAGHLEGTSFPGEPGNMAIAAHRSRTYGKMFNRLNELKPGDEIIVKDRKHTYTYQVYNISIVEPDDLSVLKRDGNNQILTLITCDPIDTGTHRLIIHAKR